MSTATPPLGEAEPVSVDHDARTISGVILPYGTLAERTSAGPVVFASGSIRHHPDLSRVKLLIEHDPHQSVGFCVALEQDANAVRATFKVISGPEGDAALRSAADRSRDGFSVGTQSEQAHKHASGSHHIITSAYLREVSLVSIPAFDDSRVLTVRASFTDDAPVDATPDAVVETTASQAAPAVSPVVAQPTPPVPGAAPLGVRASGTGTGLFRSLAAAMQTGGDVTSLRAALTDIIPANDAGHGYLGADTDLGRLWEARRTGRPFVDLYSDGRPLTGLTLKGWRWSQRPQVGPYAGDKAEIPTSTASTEPASTQAYRTAGGWDVDRAFVDLGDPDFVEALFAAAIEDYLVKSESKVKTTIMSSATALPTAPTVTAALSAIAQAAGMIGASVSAVGMAPDTWASFLGVPEMDLPWWIKGAGVTIDPVGRTANVGGLQLSVDEGLPAGTVLATDKRAALHREKTIRVQAIDLPHGGVDLGVFAYEALLINDKRAIWKVSVSA